MSRPKTKGELGIVTAPKTIQSRLQNRPVPEVNFSWGPLSVPFTFIAGGNSYPWEANQPALGAPDQADIQRTAVGQELIFTANVRLPDKDFIVRYEWNFGDGFKAFGNVARHTYRSFSPSVRTRLCVTDNRGRRFCVGRPMNLFPAALAKVGGFVLINSEPGRVTPATSRTTTGATLNGIVRSDNVATSYRFEYGPAPAPGGVVTFPTQTTLTAVTVNNIDNAVSVAITGLTTGTEYYYRLMIVRGASTFYTSALSFFTL